MRENIKHWMLLHKHSASYAMSVSDITFTSLIKDQTSFSLSMGTSNGLVSHMPQNILIFNRTEEIHSGLEQLEGESMTSFRSGSRASDFLLFV